MLQKLTAGVLIVTKSSLFVPYVHSKFVQQEAVGIYYIPWPAKKLLLKIFTQVCLPDTAKTGQPAHPTSQSCQKKKNFKQTYDMKLFCTALSSLQFVFVIFSRRKLALKLIIK